MKLLLTGASGTFGSALMKALLDDPTTLKIVAYSRNESAQARLRAEVANDARVVWILGDVRDEERLYDALHRVDTIIHAAALKRVDDNDPMELYRTNIDGTMNVVRSAFKRNVPKVLLLSTDKACAPATAYGASKLAAEFYAIYANRYGHPHTRISVTRWGNVLGSAGSVIHTWRRQTQRGDPLTITDPTASRFIMTLDQAVAFTRQVVGVMNGGEIYIPDLPSCLVGDLADAVLEEQGAVKNYPTNVIGLRAGEKRHEILLSGDESSRAVHLPKRGHYIIKPGNPSWTGLFSPGKAFGDQISPVRPGFELGSSWARRLLLSDLRPMLKDIR